MDFSHVSLGQSGRPAGLDGLFTRQLGSKWPSSGAGWTFHIVNLYPSSRHKENFGFHAGNN
ncbi:hypothetical protein V7149_03590 [Bacillus sp. JJ1503]|uniref:hypothetical protein n=1 Tax=Bacillus sp. JJ1503 TaxID=3122956 RepID=UPI0030007F31